MEGASSQQNNSKGKEAPPMFRIPIESDAKPEVQGEINKKEDGESEEKPLDTSAREQTAMKMQEKDFTDVDIALRKLLIEVSGAQALSEPEAKNLIKQMQEKAGEFAFHDGVFLDEMKAAGRPLVDTKRFIKITTATGKEAVLKIMLKTDTGEFKLQGDVLDPKGKYAEDLLN